MDLSRLATATAYVVATFARYLLRPGKLSNQAAAKQQGEEAWETARLIWTRLQTGTPSGNEVKTAVWEVASNASDENLARLREQLERAFAEDPELARVVAGFINSSPTFGRLLAAEAQSPSPTPTPAPADQETQPGREEGRDQPAPAEPAATAFTGIGPACSVCGRQDETLRVVIYPYVISLLVVTMSRSFAGLWCRRHANQRLALASLVTATIGWFGIPWGLIRTPGALGKLAGGGVQPTRENYAMLRDLANAKLREGDAQGAMRCLEEAFKFSDTEADVEKLEHLYQEHGVPRASGAAGAFVAFLETLLGGALIGVMIGVLDYLATEAFAVVFADGAPLYISLLSWAPLLAMSFLGGIILFHLIEGALTAARTRQKVLAITLAAVTGLLAAYGIPTGESLTDIAFYGLGDLAQGTPADALLYLLRALTEGGYYSISGAIESGQTSGTIYLCILLAAAGYYVLKGIDSAIDTANWQRGLAAIRRNATGVTERPPASGWLAIVGLLLGLGAATYLALPSYPGYGNAESSRYVDEGFALYYEGRLEEAEEQFAAALDADPSAYLAHVGLAYVHLDQRDCEAALNDFQTMQRLASDDWQSLAHEGMAEAHYCAGDYDAALREYQQAIALDPEFADAHADIGYIYMHRGELDEAQQYFEKAIQIDPEAYSAHVGLGYVQIEREDCEAALDTFQTMQRLAPDGWQPTAHEGIAESHYCAGDSDAAFDEYEQAIALDPEFADAHGKLGFIHLERNELDEAQERFEEAIRIDPEDYFLQTGLGMVELERGDCTAASERFRRILEIAPDSAAQATVHSQLGGSHYCAGDLDAAFQEYEQAIALDPELAEPHLFLGYVYLHRGDFQPAIEQFEQAIGLEPQWSDAHALQAVAYYQLDQHEAMEAALQRALDLRDEEVYSHNIALNLVYSELNDFVTAEAYALAAVDASPNDADSLLYLASTYRLQGKMDEAAEAIERAAEIDADYAEVNLSRSQLYVAQENLDAAIEELALALQTEPQDKTTVASIHVALSFIYYQQGRVDEAVAEATEAIAQDPHSSNAHSNLAFAYRANGQLEAATEAAEEAVRLWPKADRPHYALGLCLMDAGQTEAAIAEMETFLNLTWDRAYVRDEKAAAEAYLAELK